MTTTTDQHGEERAHRQDASAAEDAQRPGPSAALRWGLAAWVVYALMMAGLICLVPQSTRQAFDQNNFHARAISRFAEQLPSVDLHDYESATTPLYHIVLAVVARLVSPSLLVLRLAGSLASAALVGAAVWLCARRIGAVTGGRASFTSVALALPLACSVYIVSAGTSLLPDSAGWLGVLCVLALSLARRVSIVTMLAGGATLVVLVLTRQIHAWAGLPLVVSAWLGTRDSLPLPPVWAQRGKRDLNELSSGDVTPATSRSDVVQGLLRAIFASAACAPAALVLLSFLSLWGGLVPPAFQARGSALTIKDVYTSVSGVSPATPAFLLALVGVFSPFFAGYAWRTVRRGAWALPAVIASAFGLVAGLLPSGTYSVEAGRYSGLWGLFKRVPTVMDRSLPLAALSALGAACLMVWWQATPRRDRLVLGAALLAFTLAHSAQALVWQRYMEPFVLIAMMLAASGCARRRSEWPALHAQRIRQNAASLGPVALASIQLGAYLFGIADRADLPR